MDTDTGLIQIQIPIQQHNKSHETSPQTTHPLQVQDTDTGLIQIQT